MLSKEDTELLCRVGPHTPMGEVMRQYWIPFARSAELPVPDGAPVRIRLLGEDLIAFRVTTGKSASLPITAPIDVHHSSTAETKRKGFAAYTTAGNSIPPVPASICPA